MIGSIFNHLPWGCEEENSSSQSSWTEQKIGLIKSDQRIELIKSDRGIELIKLDQTIEMNKSYQRMGLIESIQYIQLWHMDICSTATDGVTLNCERQYTQSCLRILFEA